MEAAKQVEPRDPVIVLRDARAVFAEVKSEMVATYAKFEATNAPLLERLKLATSDMAVAEKHLKDSAKAAYDQNHEDTRHYAGVQVCVGEPHTTYNYELNHAREWAWNHADPKVKESCLALNAAGFEQNVCESKILRPDFVTVKTESLVTVRVAKDLDKALAEAEKDGGAK